jgi:hypothetical protein
MEREHGAAKQQGMKEFFKKIWEKPWCLVIPAFLLAVLGLVLKLLYPKQVPEQSSPEIEGIPDSWEKAESDPEKPRIEEPLRPDEIREAQAKIAAELERRK